MRVRNATDEDIKSIIEMARDFYAHTVYDIPFDEGSTRENIETSMSYELCFIAEDSEGVEAGFILGVASPFLVNRDHYVCAELAWWVMKEYRNTSAGIKLLKALEGGAKEAGCVYIAMMCLENLEPDMIASMYEKMGYAPAERTYFRRL